MCTGPMKSITMVVAEFFYFKHKSVKVQKCAKLRKLQSFHFLDMKEAWRKDMTIVRQKY